MSRLSRRTFVGLAAASGAALALPRALSGEEPGAGKKKLLILGGTRFLGPELVEAAKAKGWTITLFNRGKSNPGMFLDIEQIHGDRNTDEIKRLGGRKWDAVVDTSGFFPKQIRSAAAVLSGNVGHYTFISSISAYESSKKPGLDEGATPAKLPAGTDPDTLEKITDGNYGALKYLCEEAAEKAFPGKALRIRPGYIVGQRDGSDRFTSWPVRVERGGEMIAPGTPKDPIQFIDVRDLAEWTIRLVDKGTAGSFNATGPKSRLEMGPFLETCKRVIGSNVTFVWIDEKTLVALGLKPDEDFPIWTPASADEAGLSDISIAKALKAGLTFRPIEATIKDTLAWWKSLPEERRSQMRAGLPPDKEAAVLKAYHETRSGAAEKKAAV